MCVIRIVSTILSHSLIGYLNNYLCIPAILSSCVSVMIEDVKYHIFVPNCVHIVNSNNYSGEEEENKPI